MGEGKPIVTPITRDSHVGSATATQGVNTNLDPNLQGGPSTASDRAVVSEIEEQHAESGQTETGEKDL